MAPDVASLETEWAQDHPVHVVAKWLGNTPKIAAAPYLQVRDCDFERAVQGGAKSGAQAAQKAAQRVAAASGEVAHNASRTREMFERGRVFAGNDAGSEYPRQESNL